MPKDPRLERAGVSGFNKPKRTHNHPTKSHVVVAKEGERSELQKTKGPLSEPLFVCGVTKPRTEFSLTVAGPLA